MSKPPRLVCFVPNAVGVAPGQRVRVEAWAQHLRSAGWVVVIHPFASEQLQRILYKRGRYTQKLLHMLVSYVLQLRRVLTDGRNADVVLIYREAALIGPAVMERLVRLAGIPTIVDLDDPVFIPYRSPLNGFFSLLKFSRKTDSICAMSSMVIAINESIAGYARKHCKNVRVIPNFIDTVTYVPRSRPRSSVCSLVWIGSHSTFYHLKAIKNVLGVVMTETGCELKVIGPAGVNLEDIRGTAVPWSADTEVLELQDADIGIAPLEPNKWNDWKLFYKIIQYMAVGLPVISTRTRANSELVIDGVTGFLVQTDAEWHEKLLLLINSPDLRRQMGMAGRRRIEKEYAAVDVLAKVEAAFNSLIYPMEVEQTA